MNERAAQLNSQGLACLNEKDYVRAYKYFEEAATLGDSNAIYNVGFCCFHGHGVSKDYARAHQILKQFIKTKSNLAVSAAYLCGLIFDHGGFGVKSNPSQAAIYYKIGAEKGHAWSSLLLGRLCFLHNFPENPRELIETAMRKAPNDYELQKAGKRILLGMRLHG